MRPTHEQLLNGEVYTTSIINEVDFAVEEPKAETATARARRRWRMPEAERKP